MPVLASLAASGAGIAAIAASNAALPRPRLVLYAAPARRDYDTRRDRLPGPFPVLRGLPDTAGPVAAPGGDTAPEVPSPDGGRPEADRLARIAADTVSVPDIDGPTAATPPSDMALSRELDRRKLRFARSLMAAADAGEWTTSSGVVKHTGLSRSWVMAQLREGAREPMSTDVPRASSRTRAAGERTPPCTPACYAQ